MLESRGWRRCREEQTHWLHKLSHTDAPQVGFPLCAPKLVEDERGTTATLSPLLGAWQTIKSGLCVCFLRPRQGCLEREFDSQPQLFIFFHNVCHQNLKNILTNTQSAHTYFLLLGNGVLVLSIYQRLMNLFIPGQRQA